MTHNLTTINGWETSNYLNSLRSPTRHNITQYWNENDRFRKFNFTGVKACSIIYCGANTVGADGLRFAREYPSCQIWFLEPVPVFYEQFVHSPGWKLLMASNTSKLYHAYMPTAFPIVQHLLIWQKIVPQKDKVFHSFVRKK